MTTCLPLAQGVPGLPTAPNWFSTDAAAPPLRPDIDDPRWTGAYNRGFGDGTGLEAQFRGVYMNPDWLGKKSLFLQWNVVFDGSLDNGLDRLYVGFNNGGSNPADTLVLKVVAYNSSSVDIAAGAPGSVLALTMDATTGLGTPLAAPPGWLNNTKVWLTRTPIGWAIDMYVPYDPAAAGLFSDAGIKLTDPFNFFYQIYVLTPTRISGSAATGGFVAHKWPLASSNVFSGLSGDVYPHPPTSWDSFHPSTGAGDPMCPTTGGVSILSSGVANMVDGGAPNIIIRFSKTGVPPLPVNTLFANVDNQTGAALPPTSITARFRIADWGSLVADPAAPWDDVRGGAAVTNAVPIPIGKPVVTAGNPPPLNFNWQLSAAEAGPYMGAKPSDQCILVELKGAGITFFSDSARQNHLILPASQVVRRAQISVEGLTPLAGSTGHRDVYLAIEQRNMPPPQEEVGSTVVWDERKIAMLRQREIDRESVDALAKRGLLAALAMGRMALDAVVDLQPTYRVHVYHATGQHLTVNGVDYPILAAQTSFGMYPDHVGSLTGWQTGLQFPAGALKEEITPQFLRVHVPDNGKIHATVTVEALEPGSGGGGTGTKWPWWVWLLLLLLLLILIVLFK